MGHELLIRDLREKSRQTIKKIWEDAKAEAARYQKEKEAAFREEETRLTAAGRDACSRMIRKTVREAEHQAYLIRLRAENNLAQRLHAIGLESLTRLRGQDDYEQLFTDLADELPPLKWDSIRVNPEDVKRAEHLFPDVPVTGDDGIVGGIFAQAENGRITVNNTLEKRFERCWPILLPEIIRRLFHEHGISISAA